MNEKVIVSQMNYKEKLKYKTIIKVVNGNIDKRKASVIIGCLLLLSNIKVNNIIQN